MTETPEQFRARQAVHRHQRSKGRLKARFIKETRAILRRKDLDGFQKVVRISAALDVMDGKAS